MSRTAAYITLMGLLLFEYTCFHHYLITSIIPNYPSGVDQANYLFASYSLYNDMLHIGIIKALSQYQLWPTSFLFIIQSGLFFLLFGASRLAALSLNFLYFTALQLTCFYTIKKLTHRYLYGFLFIGILLSTNSFFRFGGAIDYRIDFMALCLYGILVCFILQSHIFIRRNWVIASAMVATCLVLMRFLTVTYVVGMSLCMLTLYALQWTYKNNNLANIKIRLKNIMLFNIILSVILTPILWMHRHVLISYYVVGHVTGNEKYMRAKMAGITDTFKNIIYYPTSFITHLTTPVLIEIALMLGMLFSLYCIFYQSCKHHTLRDNYLDEVIFLLIAIFVPLTILTLDLSKSSIVANIVLTPFILLFIWIYSFLYQNLRPILSGTITTLSYYFAVLFLATGVYHFIHLTQKKINLTAYYENSSAINKMINDIGNHAVASNNLKISLTADKYSDFFAAIPTFYYETHGVILHFDCAMGCASQHSAGNLLTILNKIHKTNLFISSTSPIPPWPSIFETSIKSFRPELKKEALRRLTLMNTYYIEGSPYQVYATP